MALFEVRAGIRAGETGDWGILRQRATLEGDPARLRIGENLSRLASVIAQRQSFVPAAVDARAGVLQIQLPEMIAISPSLGIMRDEVTVGLFRQVMQEYTFEGHNADKLQAILNGNSGADNALTYVNLFDAGMFAKQLSSLTYRQFRVQTEDEWLMARDRLSGSNWTWTETQYSGSSYVLYVLRCLSNADRSDNYPGLRCNNNAVRLVEDL